MHGISNVGVKVLVSVDVDLGAICLPGLRATDEAEASGRTEAGNETKILLRSLVDTSLRTGNLNLQYPPPLECELGNLSSERSLSRATLTIVRGNLEKHSVADLQIAKLVSENLDVTAELARRLFALNVANAQRPAPSRHDTNEAATVAGRKLRCVLCLLELSFLLCHPCHGGLLDPIGRR